MGISFGFDRVCQLLFTNMSIAFRKVSTNSNSILLVQDRSACCQCKTTTGLIEDLGVYIFEINK